MNPGVSLWLVLSLLATSQAANNPEVSWGDWLVMDEAEPGTSILLRRITPKSVFVAPSFNGCSEGYQQDSLGRCVKVVKVNQKAQWNFFLERINSMYAPSSTSKQPQKEAGPFHISLPLGSDGSQEEDIVRKRVPPIIRDDITRKPLVRVPPTTTLPPPPPTTTIWTTTQEPTTSLPTILPTTDCGEVSTTEKDTGFQSESTTEWGKVSATTRVLDIDDLEGQPTTTEVGPNVVNQETPKVQNVSQLPEKPFVIIVTNEPVRSADEATTSYAPQTTTEEVISEVPTEFPTESLTSEPPPRTTAYYDTSIRPTVKNNLVYTFRPECDPTKSHNLDSSGCDQNAEPAYDTRKVSRPETSSPTPFYEPNPPVRFPSDSVVLPVHKTQSYVRFPEIVNPHDDRPGYWWPSWQVRRYPGVQGWPTDVHSSEQQLRIQYPPYTHYSWSDPSVWRRKLYQRD